ncbi:MAG: hypothetical protein KBA02_02815 [Paludibacteraceae bacterium]|jgi:hypothetical protein|nr:hypothetical protein [Paludibacteraceae bacterium]OQA49560.1 MAG: hypothetical protein BWY47_00727 [Bacteroidetes bacterium ADurb.Bin302]
MALLFFSQRKPKKFKIKPRYYDEHKDRLAQSEARVRKELGIEENKKNTNSYDNIHNALFNSLDRNRQEKNSKMRLGIILGIFVIVIYLFFHYAG